MSRRIALVLRRVIARTEDTELRAVWSFVYEAVARGVSLYVGRGEGAVAAYARGSLAVGDAVYGYSDVDLAIVAPDDPVRPGDRRARIDRRWKRLRRVVPAVGKVVQFAVYEEAELREASASSTLLARVPVHLTSPPRADEAGLRVRPGLEGPHGEWRLLRGPDRRVARATLNRDERLIAAWLELQFVWRFAFTACLAPRAPSAPYAAVKFVADPVRIWLWLVHGERVRSRTEALERALVRMPEEEQAVRHALDLRRMLKRSPESSLAETLPALVRLSARLGRHVVSEVEPAGTTEIRLVGTRDSLALRARADEQLRELTSGDPVLLPLADWRARAWPLLPDDALSPVQLDAGSPTAVAAAARAAGEYGPYPAISVDGLVVLPGPGLLRAVQCEATDPVSFAVLKRATTAHFPNVAGWSAQDSARRAVAEHRAWLGASRDSAAPVVVQWMDAQLRTSVPALQTLGRLLTAAQAALFLESVEANAPQLAVTMAATARALDARLGGAGAVGEEAYEQYRACRVSAREPCERITAALRERVLRLPPYEFETPWGPAPVSA